MWPQQHCSKFVLETLSVDIKNVNEIPEIEVCLGSNLNFTIRVLTWGLANDVIYANDYNICKKVFCQT